MGRSRPRVRRRGGKAPIHPGPRVRAGLGGLACTTMVSLQGGIGVGGRSGWRRARGASAQSSGCCALAQPRPARPSGARRTRARIAVLHRHPTPREAHALVAAIRAEPTITGYSVSEWTRRRDVYLAFEPDECGPVGAALVHHLRGGWSELAVLYVYPGFRGRGVATRLARRAVADLAARGRRVLMFYSTRPVARIAVRLGFRRYPTLRCFCRSSARDALFYGLLYLPQWLASPYRVREMRRKRRELGARFAFSVGTVTPTPRGAGPRGTLTPSPRRARRRDARSRACAPSCSTHAREVDDER